MQLSACSLVGGWESVQTEYLISTVCLDPAETDCSSHLTFRCISNASQVATCDWILASLLTFDFICGVRWGVGDETADEQKTMRALRARSLREGLWWEFARWIKLQWKTMFLSFPQK